MVEESIEKIALGIVGIMVLFAVVTTLFAELNISTVLNKTFFTILILTMFAALIFKIIDILKDLF